MGNHPVKASRLVHYRFLTLLMINRKSDSFWCCAIPVCLGSFPGYGSSVAGIRYPPGAQVFRQHLPRAHVSRHPGWNLRHHASGWQARCAALWHHLSNIQQPQLPQSKGQTQGHHRPGLQRWWVLRGQLQRSWRWSQRIVIYTLFLAETMETS